MTVLFPFEEKFYQKAGVPVRWVGHPIVDALSPYRSAGAPLAEGEPPIVALVGGSRRGRSGRCCRECSSPPRRLRLIFPGIRFRLVESPTLPRGEYARMEAADIERIAPEGRWERLRQCQRSCSSPPRPEPSSWRCSGCRWSSGTGSTPASWALARLLVDVPHVGLVNLVAGERIVPWAPRRNALVKLLETYGVGTTYELELWRDGAAKTVALTVEQSPRDVGSALKAKDAATGLTVKELTYEVLHALHLPADAPGVLVSDVEQGMAAFQARIGPNELVREMDGEPVADPTAFTKRLADARTAGKTSVRIVVQRLDKSRFVDLRLSGGESTSPDRKTPPSPAPKAPAK